jgi:glutamine synthetase
VKADAAPLDRGAAVRVAPLFGSDPQERARQFNLEFRVADATANPYLALAVLIQAGLDGIRHARRIDTTQVRPLPTSLIDALALLEANDAAGEWLGAELLSGYLLFKKAEVEGLRDLDENEICRRYAEVY